MYKNSLGVFLRSAGMALVLGVVSAMASSCGGNKENNEPEPVKESVEFTQTTVSIPIDGNGAAELNKVYKQICLGQRDDIRTFSDNTHSSGLRRFRPTR